MKYVAFIIQLGYRQRLNGLQGDNYRLISQNRLVVEIPTGDVAVQEIYGYCCTTITKPSDVYNTSGMQFDHICFIGDLDPYVKNYSANRLRSHEEGGIVFDFPTYFREQGLESEGLFLPQHYPTTEMTQDEVDMYNMLYPGRLDQQIEKAKSYL